MATTLQHPPAAAVAPVASLPTKTRYFWVMMLYFMEGLPMGVFSDALPVYCRLHGMSLRFISHLNILQLPWSLKIFWAPWVDRYGKPQVWIGSALLLLAVVHGLLGFYEVQPQPLSSHGLMLLLLLLTTASATQDLAIDGYFIRLLPAALLPTSNSLRVTAYRVAMLLGGGGLVMLAAALGSWGWLFGSMTLLFLLLALLVTRLPKAPYQSAASATPSLSQWWAALLVWLRQPAAWGTFAFIILFKLGDKSMAAMLKPFWVDQGLSAMQIGLFNTTLGLGMSILGVLLGGIWVQRYGVLHALLGSGLLLSLSNLSYAVLASYTPTPAAALYAVAWFEHLTQGLSTTAEMVLFTRICTREHASTQFALLTALGGLTRALAAQASGWGAETFGFATFFYFACLLGLPAYFFYPAVCRRINGVAPNQCA